MYIVVYFNEFNIVMQDEFQTVGEARAFAATKDWAKIVTVTSSRTITDVAIS